MAGIGSGVFYQDNLIDLSLSQPSQDAAFVDSIGGFDILGVDNPVFAAYDLKTFIGPVSGPAFFNDVNDVFGTTAGLFEIYATSGPGTFQAATIPEPSTITLTGIAILGLLFARCRKGTLLTIAVIWAGRRSRPSPNYASYLND